jgi:hypothetical protein
MNVVEFKTAEQWLAEFKQVAMARIDTGYEEYCRMNLGNASKIWTDTAEEDALFQQMPDRARKLVRAWMCEEDELFVLPDELRFDYD